MSETLARITRENNAETAIWILGIDNKAKSIVKDFILENGMKSFLLHHEELELPKKVQEKIEVLKRVMQKYDGDIETINFGDVDGLD